MMSHHFENAGVFVTGAGSGIGYAICHLFAQAGAVVALNDIDADLAQQAAVKINASLPPTPVTPYPGDVADVTAVRQLIDTFAHQHGRLDIVVANAGITSFGPFLEYTPDTFNRLVDVNLRGSYFTAQAAAQKMIDLDTPHGRLLFMSSVTGVQAYANLSAYGMTKAGLRHLARVLAVELGPHHITVNAVCPGATLTERTQQDDPHYAAHWADVNPNGRVGTVTDIAETVRFLASPQAHHITGQTIVVDGGWTLTSLLP